MFQQSRTLTITTPAHTWQLPINEGLSEIGQNWTEKDFQFLVLKWIL
jgi:hypothetical protein